jgi:hypothetical protein
MEQRDKPEFVELLTQVLGFYNQTVSPFSVGVWWQACQGVELSSVRKALTSHAMDPDRGHFAPKPSDIVRQLLGTTTDRSLIAWGKVYEAMQRVGSYRSVAFDDGAIHCAIEDMGGWPKMCRYGLDELQFVQKRFCDAYKAYSSRDGLQYPSKLLGEHDVANAAQGFTSTSPALVGNPDVARRVMATGAASVGRAQITTAGSVANIIARLESGQKDAA